MTAGLKLDLVSSILDLRIHSLSISQDLKFLLRVREEVQKNGFPTPLTLQTRQSYFLKFVF